MKSLNLYRTLSAGLLLAVVFSGCGKSSQGAREKLSQRGVPFTVAAFHQSAQSNQLDLVTLFLHAGIHPDPRDEDASTPLMYATGWKNADMVRLLVEAGANVNAADENGMTPLLIAAGDGAPEILNLLISAGADVNRAHKTGNTPLMSAAAFGHDKCVTLLLDNGANVNARDSFPGFAAVHKASIGGHSNIVDLLMKKGAIWYKTE